MCLQKQKEKYLLFRKMAPVSLILTLYTVNIAFFAIAKTQKLVLVAQLLKPLTHVVCLLTRC